MISFGGNYLCTYNFGIALSDYSANAWIYHLSYSMFYNITDKHIEAFRKYLTDPPIASWFLNLHKRLKRLIKTIQNDSRLDAISFRRKHDWNIPKKPCSRVEKKLIGDDKAINKSEVVGWKFLNRSQRAIKLTIHLRLHRSMRRHSGWIDDENI